MLSNRRVQPGDYVNQPGDQTVRYVVTRDSGAYDRFCVSRRNPINQSWGITQYDDEDVANTVAAFLNNFTHREVH